ncbi:MAG: glycosyltransferase [Candidatus Moranbacteria bacterium]|nr:glycosyltransferase [Candidatus Moranbacteria bacterium]
MNNFIIKIKQSFLYCINKKNQKEKYIFDDFFINIFKKNKLKKFIDTKKLNLERIKGLYILNRLGILNNSNIKKNIKQLSTRFKVNQKIPKKEHGFGISVIILNFNGEKYLKRCLESIFNQDYRKKEIIVVDNASTDKSVQIIQENYLNKVKLIKLNKPVGFSAGNNIGIKKAKFNYIFLLNNDTELEQNCLYSVNKRIKNCRNKKWGVMACKMRLKNYPKILNSLGISLQKKEWGFDNFIGCVDFFQHDDLPRLFGASFGACIIKKSLFKKIGYLDENYFFYYEDTDFCYRAQLSGYAILPCPQAIVYHEFSKSSANDERGFLFKAKLAISNRLYLIIKNFYLKALIRYLLSFLVNDLSKMIMALKNFNFNTFLNYLKAYLRFIKILPLALKQRSKINKLKNNFNPCEPTFFLYNQFHCQTITKDKIIAFNRAGLKFFKLPNHRIRFAFFGYACYEKGIELLLASFENLNLKYQKKIDLELHVFGEIVFKKISERSRKIFLNLSLNKKIFHYHKYKHQELSSLMKSADVVIIPSLWNEIYNLVLDEAKLYKKPVIVSNLGALPERVKANQNGLIFNPFKRNDLELKMEKIVLEPELIKKFSSKITQPMSFKEHGRKILNIYKHIYSKA